ncbi:hypothetical protein Aph01nite_33540 [Acrocarpospora phusangensis]|uniref:Uncharacterized protein n=1 Tax=Acrocarpospora phusangensis TaxID=1070424 RepID=A0A919QC82_9ACTN|nr:hypothetical protein [Acrocarpospora phusangensis]GIH25044.1 hypothetical protein Aph01nite_33540 [Acrocarpospora phusangensis]
MENVDQPAPTQAQEVIEWCLRALAGRGLLTSAASIARQLDRNEVQVRKVLKGERPLKPDFLRDLGVLSGIPVSELFQAIGWLPEWEVTGAGMAELAHGMKSAIRALESAQPYLAGLIRTVPAAPFTAAELLLSDVTAAERFDVRLAQVVSGLRYRAITTMLAEFSPQPGVRPLAEDTLTRMAGAAGVTWRPGDDGCEGDFGSIRLELMARTNLGLNDGQEYTWQGGASHRTWKSAARAWPAHLLVQDTIGGRQLPPGSDPWGDTGQRTIVMVGGRHGTGPAAALLAEALGWQYVLVRPNLALTREGHVQAVPVDAVRTRGRSWLAVADHISAQHSAGRPWKAVVLVRPAAFEADDPDFPERGRGEIDPAALRALVESPARVIYARPPVAYLRWWAERTAGDHTPGAYDPVRAAERLRLLYARIESGLGDRIAGRDLFLNVPGPEGDLFPFAPQVPDEVFDQTVRVAWAALGWLSESAKVPPTSRPGRLWSWQASLRTDPDALLPRLTIIG